MRRTTFGWLSGASLLFASTMAAFAQEPSRPAPAGRTQGAGILQLVMFDLGPAWVKEKPSEQQKGIQDHGAYMNKLINEGILVLGGPLLEDANALTINGAMMIISADSPEAARQILEKDPAHSAGLLKIVEIRPFLVTGASWRPSRPQ